MLSRQLTMVRGVLLMLGGRIRGRGPTGGAPSDRAGLFRRRCSRVVLHPVRLARLLLLARHCLMVAGAHRMRFRASSWSTAQREGEYAQANGGQNYSLHGVLSMLVMSWFIGLAEPCAAASL